MSLHRTRLSLPFAIVAALAVAACGTDVAPIWWAPGSVPDADADATDAGVADSDADDADAADSAVPDTTGGGDADDTEAPDGGTDTDPPDTGGGTDTGADTRPDDVSSNLCPIARAACTVDGSGAPPSTDLFALPLDNLSCTGGASEDIDGEVVEYIWTVAERPDGATSEIQPDDAERTSFFVDLAGRFVLSLEVVDDRGCVSEPSLVTVVARPDEDIHVQLVWSTPNDPDPNDYGFGAGTDLDLHLLHQNGCWEDPQWDCHFRSRNPYWGSTLTTTDDPSLDIDDTDGWGPENINLDNPETGATYEVGVNYYEDQGYGASYATVRIYVYGELQFEARDKEFPDTGLWWEVAAIQWPSAEITPIDLMHDSTPECL